MLSVGLMYGIQRGFDKLSRREKVDSLTPKLSNLHCVESLLSHVANPDFWELPT